MLRDVAVAGFVPQAQFAVAVTTGRHFVTSRLYRGQAVPGRRVSAPQIPPPRAALLLLLPSPRPSAPRSPLHFPFEAAIDFPG